MFAFKYALNLQEILNKNLRKKRYSGRGKGNILKLSATLLQKGDYTNWF